MKNEKPPCEGGRMGREACANEIFKKGRARALGEIFEMEVREILWRGGELKKKMRDNLPEMREGPRG